ncbi:MAG: hypothetical protein NTW29_02560 [Bacteroidetes bacterium]|nr:hypothetical protein [Bacteroidota bacterium]
MNKNHLIKGSLVVLAIAILISLTSNLSGGTLKELWKNLSSEIVGSLISFLVGYLIWDYFDKSEKSREQQNLIDKINSFEKTILELKTSVSQLYDKVDSTAKIHDIVDNQDIKVRKLLNHMARSEPFIKYFYTKLLKNYHAKFVVQAKGFEIEDEYFSLFSYIDFWNYLVSEQLKLKEIAKNKDIELSENCIIARVVHSNSIHIWTNEDNKYKFFTNKLLLLQKEFIENGGIVVRIFLGSEDKADIHYTKAMENMKDIGVETKYLKKTEFNTLRYDFLLLHDEQLIYSWHSDVNGKSLDKTKIEDFNDANEDVIERWDILYKELKSNKDPIIKIPESRKFKLRERNAS